MRDNIDVQAILSNTKFPVSLTELKLRLKDVLDCIHSLCRDVCYVYIPQLIELQQAQKSTFYKELNKSILLYDQGTVGEVKAMLTKLIEEMMCIPRTPLILTIEFKTVSTRYRYIMVYSDTSSIKILTPTSILTSIKSVYDAVNTIIKDIPRYTNIEEVRYLRIILPLDSDKLSIKFRCLFKYSNIELAVLDAVLLMLYVGNILLNISLESDRRSYF